MTRRALLAAAAMATAQDRVKIAFLGTKHSHGAEKLRQCRAGRDWDVAAVWEPGSGEAAKQAILRDPAIRVVAVAAEVHLHAELGLAALQAGKHVHLEKPPADNLRDLERMVDLARRNKLLLQMGYMWRHHPGFDAIARAVREGWLGEVHMVRGQMNTLVGAASRREWARFRGGQMFEQGCHLIDPMVRMLGRPAKITPFLRHDGAFDDTLADNTVAVFEWRRTVGVITHSVLQPNAGAHRMFEVMGANGTATLRPIEGPPRLEFDLARAAGPYRAGRQEVPLPAYRRYVGDLEELARCVREGKPLGVTLDEEIEVQRALLAASMQL
jgi:predicted dehydrogenase